MAYPRFLAAPLVLLFTLLLACGGGGDDDNGSSSTSVPTVDPKTLLSNAAKATGDLDSFHFRLEHENGTSPLPLGLKLVSAEGDVLNPDRLKADVKAKSGSLNLDVDVVAVGDKTWITNPFTRKLTELPGASLSDITDPIGLLQVLTSQMRDVQSAGSEKIDGADTYHLSGNLPSDSLTAVFPAEKGKTVKVDVWIGKNDNLPRRAELTGPLTSSDAANIIRRIDFSKFNEKVDITAPS